MENGTILDFSAYKLIKSFEGYGETYRFNKFMYLLNKELKKDGIDIKLPYAWYRHGIVVEFDNNNLNYLSSLDFSEIPNNFRNKIVKNIELLMKKYRYKKTDEINAEIYKEAPYKFQNNFREMLKIVNLWKEGNKTLDNYFEGELSGLMKYIQNALNEFPFDDFNDLYPLFLEWENFLSQLIELDYPNKEIAAFVEKFWFTFTKKLRLLTNLNIDKTVLNEWEKEYKLDFLYLENYLFNFSFEFYNEYYSPQDKHVESVEDLSKLDSNIPLKNLELHKIELSSTSDNESSIEELHRIACKTIWE